MPAVRASRTHEGDRVAHRADGDRESSLGYTRIQGALKNLHHHVARSTVARILKDNGIPPAPGRPSSWRTFLRAHWGAIAAADFFTTEVWTARGLVTYYTLFVLDLKSRRVRIVGSAPNPDAAFMVQQRGCSPTLSMGYWQASRADL